MPRVLCSLGGRWELSERWGWGEEVQGHPPCGWRGLARGQAGAPVVTPYCWAKVKGSRHCSWESTVGVLQVGGSPNGAPVCPKQPEDNVHSGAQWILPGELQQLLQGSCSLQTLSFGLFLLFVVQKLFIQPSVVWQE